MDIAPDRPLELPDPIARLLALMLPAQCTRPESLLHLPRLLLSDSKCLRATLSRYLGLGVVAGAGLIKLPQILTIISAGTVQGLSLTTFLIETFGYTYNFAAHYRGNYPLSTYGDFGLLIIQNLVILTLFFLNTPSSSTKAPLKKQLPPSIIALRLTAYFIIYLTLFLLLCSPLFPQSLLSLLVSGNIVTAILARLPQIRKNYIDTSTGTLSLVSSAGIWLGSTARVFTTLQDVGNNTILYGYVVSSILNGIITAQIVFYKFVRPKMMTKAYETDDAKRKKFDKEE